MLVNQIKKKNSITGTNIINYKGIMNYSFQIIRWVKEMVKRTIRRFEGEEFEVLNIPWEFQPLNEKNCFPKTVQMCLKYFKNEYGNRKLERELNVPTLDELYHLTGSNDAIATRFRRKLFQNLKNTFKHVNFEPYRRSGSIKKLKERLDEDLPTIVAYNLGYVLQEMRTGDSHSSIVIGVTPQDEIILCNSIMGQIFIPDIAVNCRGDFMESWDLSNRKMIIVDPILDEQINLEEAK